MPYVRNNLSNMQRALALAAAGLALTASPALARPDYPAAPVASSVIDMRSPDAKDAADAQAIGTSSPAGTTSSSPQVAPTAERPTVEPVKADAGFDWGSAGMGAGAVFAVTLIGLAGVAVMRRDPMHPVQ